MGTKSVEWVNRGVGRVASLLSMAGATSVALSCVSLAHGWAEPAWVVELPGTVITGLSADGRTACGRLTTIPLSPIRWRRDVGNEALQTLTATFHNTSSISWDGSVVSGATGLRNPRNPCWWNGSGQVTTLSEVSIDTNNGAAWAASGNGLVFGGQSLRADPFGLQAVLWQEGALQVVPSPLVGSQVSHLSFDGSVAIGFGLLGTSTLGFWYERHSGHLALMQGPLGAMMPLGLSPDGRSAVGFVGPPGSSQRAAVWTRERGVELFGRGLEAYSRTEVVSVSADSRVWAGNLWTNSTTRRAWIWDAQFGLRLLQDVAEVQLGVEVPELDWLHCMSADGSTFVIGTLDSSSIILHLNSACPGDVDNGTGSGARDDEVNIDDLSAFLVWMGAGDLRADLDNGSGNGVPDMAISIDDLLYFLTGFEVGC
jgi:uncharacterized membrane protein